MDTAYQTAQRRCDALPKGKEWDQRKGWCSREMKRANRRYKAAQRLTNIAQRASVNSARSNDPYKAPTWHGLGLHAGCK